VLGQTCFDAAAECLRRAYDLQDVATAIGAAGRLMAESLEKLAADLHKVAELSDKRDAR
jgi:malonyl CoA-acyl carrier protein transacylase